VAWHWFLRDKVSPCFGVRKFDVTNWVKSASSAGSTAPGPELRIGSRFVFSQQKRVPSEHTGFNVSSCLMPMGLGTVQMSKLEHRTIDTKVSTLGHTTIKAAKRQMQQRRV